MLLTRHNVGLVVIDSIAANYRAERSATSSSGAALGLRSSQLIKLGHQFRSFAREYDCAIVVSNQVADRFSPTSPPPPQLRQQMGSSPPPHSLSPSPPHAGTMMQPLDAAIMPPPQTPPTSHLTPYQQPPSSSIYPPLSLDHQQNFFTGWSSAPPPPSSNPSLPPTLHHHQPAPTHGDRNLKTPALGLVWTNQIACRIALTKERNFLGITGHGDTGRRDVAEKGDDRGGLLWRRYMKVVFAAWGPSTGVMDKGVEFEIWDGGMRRVERGSVSPDDI